MENVKTSPTFNSTFYMIKTDGTSEHKHSISDFKLNTGPIVNTSNNSTIWNGTSTVTIWIFFSLIIKWKEYKISIWWDRSYLITVN